MFFIFLLSMKATSKKSSKRIKNAQIYKPNYSRIKRVLFPEAEVKIVGTKVEVELKQQDKKT